MDDISEKQTKSEIDKKNNNRKNSNNLNDFLSSDDEFDDLDCNINTNVNIEKFENEKKNDSKYLEISLDMSSFPKYEKIETNTKTIILYRIGISIIDLGNMDPISELGFDATWIGIESNRECMIIGSIYHSPSYNCDYNDIVYQMNQIKEKVKIINNQHLFWQVISMQKMEFGVQQKQMIVVFNLMIGSHLKDCNL